MNNIEVDAWVVAANISRIYTDSEFLNNKVEAP